MARDIGLDSTRRRKIDAFLEGEDTDEPKECQHHHDDDDDDDDDDDGKEEDDDAEDVRFSTHRVGRWVPVEDVPALLPRRLQIPSLPWMDPPPFAVRLGVALNDFVEVTAREARDLPQPDFGRVRLHKKATLRAEDGQVITIRAVHKFRGRPVYSFVELTGHIDADRWFGLILSIFEFVFEGVTRSMCLVLWLNNVSEGEGNRHCALGHSHAFTWYSDHPDCVDLRSILGVVTFVESFVKTASGKTVFVLVDSS